ncbi:hypothetical protein Micbo1qcDRAFT_160592 [Microdochium bolleyi]|uniref:Pentatricopeptide repeat domain-containing protein n=1 Tax=Microdochium bolleyi TaxID=196109 RepID=A0A136J6Z1_9PEZI|nr:hypothetical protein Micbo1qcDRAFT_160592 [Microdochium bolleyi]
MRRASQCGRYVKLQQLLRPAQSRCQLSTPFQTRTNGPDQVRLLTVEATAQRDPLTRVETTPAISTSNDSTHTKLWRPMTKSRPIGSGRIDVVETKQYGKWQALLYDSARLAVESDFSRKHRVRKCLVDKPENHGDLALWSCLLDYQKRVNGDAGVDKIWKAVWSRKALYKTDGPLATSFWQTILDTALRSNDSRSLQNIYIYGEWMKHMHGTEWPSLYTTVIRHFLATHQHKKVVQWHVRLFPNFDPGASEFLSILRQFSHDSEVSQTSTLEALYTMSPYRPMYDSMVPYLYNHGMSQLATRWRNLFVAHNDLPLQLAASRPFLRFLKGYFPEQRLSEEEHSHISGSSHVSEEDPRLSRELVNRVHGHTFGITVKNYNDNLGSRWFATSWVSLDTAIATVAALGIEKIGPLSLQAVAVREGNPEGLLSRIEQLRANGIEMPDGNFPKLLVYFAERQLGEMYTTLLRSDFHPDVWDDLPLQKRLIESESTTLDVRTYKLLLSANHYILQQSAKKTANALVKVHFQSRDWQGLLAVLGDMEAMRIGLDRSRAKEFFHSLLADIPRDAEVHSRKLVETIDSYLAVCKQLARMETPIPTRCWTRFMRYFGRTGRLNDLEELTISLVDAYVNPKSARPGFIPIHMDDLPLSMRDAFRTVKDIVGVYVPKDLPTDNPMHPLRQILSPKMVSNMVRWTFSTTMSHYPASTPRLQRGAPGFSRLHCARIVKHLRLLKNRGLCLDTRHLARRVIVRLSYLYGPGAAVNRRTERARAMNIVPLAAMKELIDDAWGNELLPPLPELRAQIARLSRKVTPVAS